jgi:hypothetical protein
MRSWLMIIIGLIAVIWAIIMLDLFGHLDESRAPVMIDSTWQELDSGAMQPTPAETLNGDSGRTDAMRADTAGDDTVGGDTVKNEPVSPEESNSR